MVYDRVYTPPGKYCRRAPPLPFREKIHFDPGPVSDRPRFGTKKRGKFRPPQPPISANLGVRLGLIIKGVRFPSGCGAAGQNDPGRRESERARAAAAAASSIYGQGRREEGKRRGRRERARGKGGTRAREREERIGI